MEYAKANGPGDKKKITKASVKADMVKYMGDTFPDVSIPDSTMSSYAMSYLLSGLRPDILEQITKNERKRQSKGESVAIPWNKM